MQTTVSGQELALVDAIARFERHRAGRKAVHVHMSRLKPQFRRDYHVRVAASLFDVVAQTYRGQLYRLSNSDLVFVWQNGPLEQIDEVIARLRSLLADDPITQAGDEETSARIRTWYDLETQYDIFKTVAEGLLADAEEKRAAERAKPLPGGPSAPQNQQMPRRPEAERENANPNNHSRLYDSIRNLDVSALIRRQPVCAVVGKADPVPVFTELYVSIADLQRLVMPKVDIASDRWLFQHTTSVLDRRVLALLPQLETSLEGTTSININVASVLAQEFLEFDGRIRAQTRKTIMWELQLVDIMSDLTAYLFARDFLRDRGYRICLDGLTWLTFPLIDRAALGIDLVKVAWQPEILDDTNEARRNSFQAAVQRTGIDRVILCRVDSQEAVDWGAKFGISLYQGRLIEQRLTEARKVIRVKNPASSDSRSLNALAKQGKA
jgi:EAL domain-containing protein (putative c-di-GMP-specific phosphodiesterase class I)